MKEYIERAAAINAIRQYQYPYGVEFLLANLPTADVAGGEAREMDWNPHHCKWECPDCGGMEGECEPLFEVVWCSHMDKEDNNDSDRDV